MARRKRSATKVWNAKNEPADPAYTQRLADLKLAAREVGITQEARLKWLVEFSRQDRSTWQSATRAARGNCILALTGFYVAEFMHGGVPLPDPIPPEDVDEVHAEVSKMLRDAVGGPARDVWLPDGVVRTALVRISEPSVKPAIWAVRRQYSSPLAVLHVLTELIVGAGEKLVACPWCSSPILAVGKQKFCTPAGCGQDARNYEKKNRPDAADAGKGKAR